MNHTQIIKRAVVVSGAGLALILVSGGAAMADETRPVAAVSPTTFVNPELPDIPGPVDDAAEKAARGAGKIAGKTADGARKVAGNRWVKRFAGCQYEGSWDAFVGGASGYAVGRAPGAAAGGAAGKIHGCVRGWQGR